MKILVLIALVNLALAQSALAEEHSSAASKDDRLNHIRGIGGVFFKVDDPQKVNAWYKKHFGLDVENGFTHFPWRDQLDPNQELRTVWTTFPRTSEYFGRAEQQVMINYIVHDLDNFLHTLTESGIEQVGDIETYPYGRFAWIKDIEGNKVELWEPPLTPHKTTATNN